MLALQSPGACVAAILPRRDIERRIAGLYDDVRCGRRAASMTSA
jgi:hypothetical protein